MQIPSITALVCTRDRGGSPICTVEAILANDHPDFELIVVDQSADDGTAQALTRFGSDPRLRYIRPATAGVSSEPKQKLVGAAPEEAYWYNNRPWSDERHCDNTGFEVLPVFPN